jgi:hypothetical protein
MVGAEFVNGILVSATCAALIVRSRLPVAPCWSGKGFGRSEPTCGGGGCTWTSALFAVPFKFAVTVAEPAASPETVKDALV